MKKRMIKMHTVFIYGGIGQSYCHSLQKGLETANSSSKRKKIKRNKTQKLRKKIICKYCKLEFGKNFINIHMKEKHSEKVEVCNICKKVFYSNESLKAHLNSHYQKCKICKENVLDLNKHIDIKHPSDIFSCPICNKKIITMKSFIDHWNGVHKGMLLKDFISS